MAQLLNKKKLAKALALTYDRVKAFARDGMPFPGGLTTVEKAMEWIMSQPPDYRPFSAENEERRKLLQHHQAGDVGKHDGSFRKRDRQTALLATAKRPFAQGE